MADKSTRLKKAIQQKLTPIELKLSGMITFEERRDNVALRMPLGFADLREVTEKITAIAKGLDIEVIRLDMHASLEELDAVLGDIEWLWQPWLPKGFLSFLVGEPGVGKSGIAMMFAKIVTMGYDWPLTNDSQKPGNVVWVDAEGTQQILNSRSKTFGVDRRKIFIPILDGDILGQPDIKLLAHRDQITNLVTAVRPSLIIVDSFGGVHSGGENRVEDVKPVMQYFSLLARDERTSLCVIHHLNKMKSDDDTGDLDVMLDQVRGSSHIPAMGRSIIAAKEVNDLKIKMKVIKSNLARKPEAILANPRNDAKGDLCDLFFEKYIAPKAKRSKRETCGEFLLTYLKDRDGARASEVVEAAEAEGYTRSTVFLVKADLQEKLYVTGSGKESYWHYNRNDYPEGEPDDKAMQTIERGMR